MSWQFRNSHAGVGARHLARRTHTQPQSTALHFYQNRQLELYASKEAKRLSLRQLVKSTLQNQFFSHTHGVIGVLWATHGRGETDKGTLGMTLQANL